MTLEHDVQNKSMINLKKYRQIEEFVRRQGIDSYPAGLLWLKSREYSALTFKVEELVIRL